MGNSRIAEKHLTIVAPLEDMRQYFAGRIICGRCGNSDWTSFTYLPPLAGRVIVQCSRCGLSDTKLMEPKPVDGTKAE